MTPPVAELVFFFLALVGAFGLGWFLNQRRVLKARPGSVQVGPGHPVLKLRRGQVGEAVQGDSHTHVVRKLIGPEPEADVLEAWECRDGSEVKQHVTELRRSGAHWDYIYDGARRDWGPREMS